ncbi:MAG: sigma-70 family RNA polymerase sigma factor, partial [Chloroflexota bacterium]
AIYDRYYIEVFRYVRYRIGDEMLAEDITSDVFVSYIKAIQVQQGPSKNLLGWLIGTANHKVADHIRHLYRHPVEELQETLPAEASSLPDEVERRERERILHWALAQLTNDQQHVLALLFGQGYSLEETAALMGKKVPAVKALRIRALAALQRKLGERK